MARSLPPQGATTAVRGRRSGVPGSNRGGARCIGGSAPSAPSDGTAAQGYGESWEMQWRLRESARDGCGQEKG
jgi:hypothetical protein